MAAKIFHSYPAIVKGGVQSVMAANYRGFQCRRQHQPVQLSAFVARGRLTGQLGGRLMH